MPQGFGMYARIVRDQAHFGPLLSYDQAVMQLVEMVPMPWDMWPEIEDAGMDVEYTTHLAEHPFPRLTNPREQIDGDGGGMRMMMGMAEIEVDGGGGR